MKRILGALLIILTQTFWISPAPGDSPIKVWVQIEADEGVPKWQSRAIEETLILFLSGMNQIIVSDEEQTAKVKILGRLSEDQLKLQSLDATSRIEAANAKLPVGKSANVEDLRHQLHRLLKPFIQPQTPMDRLRALMPSTRSLLIFFSVAALSVLVALRRVPLNIKIPELRRNWTAMAWIVSFILIGFGTFKVVRDSLKYHRVYEERMERIKQEIESERHREWERNHGN